MVGEGKTMPEPRVSFAADTTKASQNRRQNDSENPHGLGIEVQRHLAPLRVMIALEAVEVQIFGAVDTMRRQFGPLTDIT